MVIVRPGDIALMAFVFARYAEVLYAPFHGASIAYAAGAVVILTAVNIAGVRQGKWTQNVLTVAKVAGLAAIAAAGLFAPGGASPAPAGEGMGGGLQLALILVLFTYGGWNEMAYVAAEVKDPRRNILRALVVGAVSVTVLYLLVNLAFLRVLGVGGMAGSKAVAVDVVSRLLPDAASRIVAVLICISALGAVNGLVLTGARISYALGEDHPSFRFVGGWDPRRGSPVRALLVQGAISLIVVLLAGSFIDTIIYSAPVVWLFLLGTGLSVFVLRRREPAADRPYRLLGYPFTPALFCAACLFMLYNCLSYAWSFKPGALGALGAVVAVGIAAWLLARACEARNSLRTGKPLD